MAGIETLIEYPIIQSLGWTLLHFVWQGAVVALLVAAVLSLAGRMNAASRYVLATTGMLLMAVLPVGTFLALHLAGAPPAPVARQPTVDEVAPTLSIPRPEELARGQISSPASSTEIAASAVPALPPPQPLSWKDRVADQIEAAHPWIVLMWSLGVLVFSLRFSGGWAYTVFVARFRSAPVDDVWHDKLASLRTNLGVKRSVRILQSAWVQTPVVIGWFRPVILMPIGLLTGLSVEQIEAILAHELAHIRRYDYLANLLQTVMETLFFFHPAVWWLSNRIRVEREYCCDDIAASKSEGTLTYVKALAQLEEHRVELLTAVAAGGGSLADRIRRLVAPRSDSKVANRLIVIPGATLVGTCLIVVSCIARLGVGAGLSDDRPEGEDWRMGVLVGDETSNENEPTWSPDGNWIVFVSDRAGSATLWIVNVRGGDPRPLTGGLTTDLHPQWSPDGQQILFVSDRNGRWNVWTMSPWDGKDSSTRITTNEDGVFNSRACWSPDGSEIAFVRNTSHGKDIWTLKMDDLSRRPLTTFEGDEWDPSWSPNGKWLAFSRGIVGRKSSLWLTPVSGSGPSRELTDDEIDGYLPVWSPDGEWILFSSWRGNGWYAWLVPAMGGTPKPLTSGRKLEEPTAWSPDGEKFAFARRSGRDDPSDIWIADVSDRIVFKGTITDATTSLPWSGATVRVRDGAQSTVFRTSAYADGSFRTWLAPGEYTVDVVEAAEKKHETLTLAGNEDVVSLDFSLTPIEPPAILARSAVLYQNLRGYRDSTVLRGHPQDPGNGMTTSASVGFSFERPNRLNLSNNQNFFLTYSIVVSDGDSLTYFGDHGESRQRKAPDRLTTADTRQYPLPGGVFIHELVFAENSLNYLMKGAESIAVIDHGIEHGKQVTIVELIRPLGSLYSRWSEFHVDPVRLLLAIGDEDFLIHRVTCEFRYDMDSVKPALYGKMARGGPPVDEAEVVRLADLKLVIEERHNGIEIDPEFAEGEFATDPELQVGYTDSTRTSVHSYSYNSLRGITAHLADSSQVYADVVPMLVVADMSARLNDDEIATIEDRLRPFRSQMRSIVTDELGLLTAEQLKYQNHSSSLIDMTARVNEEVFTPYITDVLPGRQFSLKELSLRVVLTEVHNSVASQPGTADQSLEKAQGWRVLLGRFPKHGDAVRLRDRAREKLVRSDVTIQRGEISHRVMAGNFRTADEAQSLLESVEGMGYPRALIVRSEVLLPRAPEEPPVEEPGAQSSLSPLPPQPEPIETDLVDPLTLKVLALPFRDLSNHESPWEIHTQFARGLGDSLRRYEFLRVVPLGASLEYLSEDESRGQFGKERAIELARMVGADICVIAEIEDLSMKRFRVTVPLGSNRSYQGTSIVNAYIIKVVDGRSMGEARVDATIDPPTSVVDPGAPNPLDDEYYSLGKAPWGSEEFHSTLVGQSVDQSLQELAQKVSELIRPTP